MSRTATWNRWILLLCATLTIVNIRECCNNQEDLTVCDLNLFPAEIAILHATCSITMLWFTQLSADLHIPTSGECFVICTYMHIIHTRTCKYIFTHCFAFICTLTEWLVLKTTKTRFHFITNSSSSGVNIPVTIYDVIN